MSATTSDNIWNESATRANEPVAYPTTNSTMKKPNVNDNIDARRHALPEYLPIDNNIIEICPKGIYLLMNICYSCIGPSPEI